MDKSPSQNSITTTTVHNLRASLLSTCTCENSRCPTGIVLHAVLDTGTPERQRKKKNTENENKSKFLHYCFELVLFTCVNDMSDDVLRYK